MKIYLGKWLKRFFYLSLLFFIISNFIIYNHAYYFTHFVDKDIPKVTSETIRQKTWQEKLSLALLGTEIPKPRNKIKPSSSFEEVSLGNSPRLHAWWIPTNKEARGTCILFHGYSASKSSMLERSKVLRNLGYHTFLVDLRAHGDSEGVQTSIGYYEAEDVRTAFQYIKTYYKELPITLLGTSMGAVSILKAIHDYQLDAEQLIIECPFRSLSDAVCSRFENLKLPTIIFPDLLLLWGGLQTNMNCWKHDVTQYARKTTIPTLVVYGAKDPKVRRFEIDAVFNALSGERKLAIIEEAAHDRLMEDDPKTWTEVVWAFLERKKI